MERSRWGTGDEVARGAPLRRACTRLPPRCGPQGLPKHGRDGQGTLRTEHPRTPGAQGGCIDFVMLTGAKRKLQKYGGRACSELRMGRHSSPGAQSLVRGGSLNSAWDAVSGAGPAQPRAPGDWEPVLHGVSQLLIINMALFMPPRAKKLP